MVMEVRISVGDLSKLMEKTKNNGIHVHICCVLDYF